MAGFLSLGNDQFLGTYKAKEEMENGLFVVLDHATQEASLATVATGDGEVYFVENEIETIVEQGIDDADYKVKAGKFVRIHRPQAGEVLVTTKFNGTLAEGDVVAVGAGGAVEAIGARTPAIKFVVKELTVAYGKPAVKLLAV